MPATTTTDTMLDFLVASKVRNRLLRLLFVDKKVASTAELARQAHVSYGSAYAELRALESAGLTAMHEGAFAANEQHPFASVLRTLATSAVTPADSSQDDEQVRNEMFTLGAPTFGHEVDVPDVDLAFAKAVALSHRDPTLASVLPVCFYKQRDVLDAKKLLKYAGQLREKRALGFYLDLTAKLSGDKRFTVWARTCRDGRCVAERYFFVEDSQSKFSRATAKRHTPREARRWHLFINATLDSFESMFTKHARRR